MSAHTSEDDPRSSFGGERQQADAASEAGSKMSEYKRSSMSFARRASGSLRKRRDSKASATGIESPERRISTNYGEDESFDGLARRPSNETTRTSGTGHKKRHSGAAKFFQSKVIDNPSAPWNKKDHEPRAERESFDDAPALSAAVSTSFATAASPGQDESVTRAAPVMQDANGDAAGAVPVHEQLHQHRAAAQPSASTPPEVPARPPRSPEKLMHQLPGVTTPPFKIIPATLPANPAIGGIDDAKRTLLSPLFDELERRRQIQNTHIARFFGVSALLAILVAVFAPSLTVKMNVLIAVMLAVILASVLANGLKRDQADARHALEEQVRKALSDRGLNNEDILALLRPPVAPSVRSHPEPVEWLNRVLGLVWPLIEGSVFTPFIDLLEDALMQQVPGIVHSARVEDLDQGTIPLRIKSMRVLEDSSGEAFTSLDGFSEAKKNNPLVKLWKTVRGEGAHPEGPGDAAPSASKPSEDRKHTSREHETDSGDYINLEIDFSYRAPSGAKPKGDDAALADEANGASNTGEKMHMLLWMGIGLRKIAAISVPVWIEVLGIQGTMRLRLEVMPVLPFVKHVAFTFMNKPELEISAKPLGSKMVIDAMQLPLISNYVQNSIQKVIEDFICPKSYTVDLGALLGSTEGPSEREFHAFISQRVQTN